MQASSAPAQVRINHSKKSHVVPFVLPPPHRRTGLVSTYPWRRLWVFTLGELRRRLSSGGYFAAVTVISIRALPTRLAMPTVVRAGGSFLKYSRKMPLMVEKVAISVR